MKAMFPFFCLTVLMMLLTIITVVSPEASMGCMILGTEVNGDYSTEYLMLGNCG